MECTSALRLILISMVMASQIDAANETLRHPVICSGPVPNLRMGPLLGFK